MELIISEKDLNKENIEKILRSHFKDDNLKVSEVKANELFLAENDNFSSNISSYAVTILSQDGTAERQVNFVVKSTINSTFHNVISTFLRLFAKELFWFKQGLPTLAKLCPEVTKLSPECYYGYSNYEGSLFEFKGGFHFMVQMITKKKETGIILLENLRHRQPPMKMLDKTKLMTVNQVRVVFETLARLHGSFLMWKNADENSKWTEGGIREKDLLALHISMKPWMIKSSIKSTAKSVTQLLKNFGQSAEHVQKWERFAPEQLMSKYTEHLTTEIEKKKSSIITLCHGDTWTNNLLFSEDESQVVLLDYQLMLLAHPARDIWYFMAIATDAEFRSEHLKTLLKDYFNVLNPYLEKANIKMSFEQFETEVNERRDILIMYSTEMLPLILSHEKVEMGNWNSLKIIEKKKVKMLSDMPKPDDHIMITEVRRRILGLIDEALQTGFL